MQQKVKLLDQVRSVARLRHLSHRTEDVYHNFIKRYILFHDKRHPNEMGANEISEFLTHLAVEGKVSASTQNQAFFALLFLYRDVLQIKLPKIEGVLRAQLRDASFGKSLRHSHGSGASRTQGCADYTNLYPRHAKQIVC